MNEHSKGLLASRVTEFQTWFEGLLLLRSHSIVVYHTVEYLLFSPIPTLLSEVV